jgi:septum formation inhibitor MinC
MAISKVISFLSGSDRKDTNHDVNDFGENGASGGRLRNALRETGPAENLMRQLRDIIVGPQTRLNEARFEELLDILEEQKAEAEAHFDEVEKHLDETAEKALYMSGLLEGQDAEISLLKQKLDDQVQTLREEQIEVLAELRSGFQQRLEILSDVLEKRVQEIELGMRGEYAELSGALMKHISDEDTRWDKERDNSLVTLEQRIAQWRAELDDERRHDMEHLGNSIVEMGRRLMALQGNSNPAR